MSPIEAAARELYIAQNVNPAFLDDPVEQEDIDHAWRRYVPEVVAMLEALVEPSPGMASDGAFQLFPAIQRPADHRG